MARDHRKWRRRRKAACSVSALPLPACRRLLSLSPLLRGEGRGEGLLPRTDDSRGRPLTRHPSLTLGRRPLPARGERCSVPVAPHLPPATRSTAPVVKLDASDSRNTIASATSSMVPGRAIGTAWV